MVLGAEGAAGHMCWVGAIFISFLLSFCVFLAFFGLSRWECPVVDATRYQVVAPADITGNNLGFSQIFGLYDTVNKKEKEYASHW